MLFGYRFCITEAFANFFENPIGDAIATDKPILRGVIIEKRCLGYLAFFVPIEREALALTDKFKVRKLVGNNASEVFGNTYTTNANNCVNRLSTRGLYQKRRCLKKGRYRAFITSPSMNT